MATSPTTAIPLGSPAHDFDLPEVSTGGRVRLEDLPGDALVVMFLCRHCPYVVHVQSQLAALAREYGDRGAAFVGICSNDAQAYPDDAPDRLAAQKREVGFPFPYCHDETQEVARRYGAVCTPDFFVYDGDRRLAYRGQMDDTRPRSAQSATGADLRRALDAVLAGQPVPEPHHPPMGCSIKWREG